jgi:hypothetical protein
MSALRMVVDSAGAPWVLLAVGVVYTMQCASLWMHGKVGLSMALAGYAFSNVGLYLSARAA